MRVGFPPDAFGGMIPPYGLARTWDRRIERAIGAVVEVPVAVFAAAPVLDFAVEFFREIDGRFRGLLEFRPEGQGGRGGRLRRFGMKGFDEPVEQADQFSLLLFISLGRLHCRRFLRPAVIRPRALQNRLRRAVEFGFEFASGRFPDEIGDPLEFLAVQGRRADLFSRASSRSRAP